MFLKIPHFFLPSISAPLPRGMASGRPDALVKIAQNVAQPIFVCNNYRTTFTVEKSSPIICATFAILKKTTQSEESPIGRIWSPWTGFPGDVWHR
jgi:hypothetical protein